MKFVKHTTDLMKNKFWGSKIIPITYSSNATDSTYSDFHSDWKGNSHGN